LLRFFLLRFVTDENCFYSPANPAEILPDSPNRRAATVKRNQDKKKNRSHPESPPKIGRLHLNPLQGQANQLFDGKLLSLS